MSNWSELKVPELVPFEESEVKRLLAYKSWQIFTAMFLALGGKCFSAGAYGRDRFAALQDMAEEDYLGGVLPGERESRQRDFILFYVRPADWIAWLRRVDFPMSEILEGYNSARSNPGAEKRKAQGQENREELLGAAVWCLANKEKQCKGDKDRVTGESLLTAITVNAALFWPETEEPPIKGDRARKLLSKWLNCQNGSTGQTD